MQDGTTSVVATMPCGGMEEEESICVVKVRTLVRYAYRSQ